MRWMVLTGVLALLSTSAHAQTAKTYQDGREGIAALSLGDLSFADEAVSLGAPHAAPLYSNSKDALGLPDYDEKTDAKYTTLGCGGVLSPRSTDNALIDVKGSWKCQCSDAACATSSWQLQGVVRTSSGEVAGGTTGGGAATGGTISKVTAVDSSLLKARANICNIHPRNDNLAKEALDGVVSRSSKWAANNTWLSENVWIKFDLGKERKLREIKISWWNTSIHKYKIDVQVSNNNRCWNSTKDASCLVRGDGCYRYDAVNMSYPQNVPPASQCIVTDPAGCWTTIVTGAQSSGVITDAFESIPLNDATARYVRIVGRGNDGPHKVDSVGKFEENWTAMKEVIFIEVNNIE